MQKFPNCSTKESSKYYSSQKKSIKKILKNLGATEIKISNGYYYFSGFATFGEKIIYFSISDVRNNFKVNIDIMIRTAKDYKDYTGGINNHCNLEDYDVENTLRKMRIL